MPNRFQITEKHLKLLRHLNFGWIVHDQSGAPGVNPVWPYGHGESTTDVIRRILGEKPEQVDVARYQALHKELTWVLQCLVESTTFKHGHFLMVEGKWEKMAPISDQMNAALRLVGEHGGKLRRISKTSWKGFEASKQKFANSLVEALVKRGYAQYTKFSAAGRYKGIPGVAPIEATIVT
jgi:hypothetical protein